MTKLTIIGDPHIKPDNLDTISKLFGLVESMGNDCVWLGDQLDTKELIRGRCINALFDYLSTSKLNHTLLIGNHCWFNLECKEHSQEVLKVLENVIIVDKPILIPVECEKGAISTLFFPYFHDIEEFKKSLLQFKKENPKLLFMHQGVIGFDYGNGLIATGKSSGEISPSDIPKKLKVISGHFHKYAENGNITFLGTPFSHSFGESDQTKYLGVLHLPEMNLELVETNFPKHKTYYIDCGSPNPITPTLNTKDYNRVILTGSKEAVDEFKVDGFPPSTKILKKADVTQNLSLGVDETLDNLKLFELWAKENSLNPDTIDLGLNILRKV